MFSRALHDSGGSLHCNVVKLGQDQQSEPVTNKQVDQLAPVTQIK